MFSAIEHWDLNFRCGTVLEAAMRKGMRTGLVTKNPVTDATPASYSGRLKSWDIMLKILF